MIITVPNIRTSIGDDGVDDDNLNLDGSINHTNMMAVASHILSKCKTKQTKKVTSERFLLRGDTTTCNISAKQSASEDR